jgi:RNA polymerase sigma factor (sigma-70 family)
LNTGLLQNEVLEWKRVLEINQPKERTVPVQVNVVAEDEIIKGCRNKERKAQKILYERYFGKMMGMARRYIKDSEDAMEVVNTGFLKIFSNIDKFKGSGSFTGWMSKVIVNTALDHLRANKHYADVVLMDKRFETKYDVTIETTEYEDIDVEILYRMIDKLPAMSRTVFNLYAIDGYSHKEISKELNINTGTSKWHVSFARQRLREMLVGRKMNSNIEDER